MIGDQTAFSLQFMTAPGNYITSAQNALPCFHDLLSSFLCIGPALYLFFTILHHRKYCSQASKKGRLNSCLTKLAYHESKSLVNDTFKPDSFFCILHDSAAGYLYILPPCETSPPMIPYKQREVNQLTFYIGS